MSVSNERLDLCSDLDGLTGHLRASSLLEIEHLGQHPPGANRRAVCRQKNRTQLEDVRLCAHGCLLRLDCRLVFVVEDFHADAQQIKDRVQGWLQTEAKRLFGERLAYYADKLGVAYKGYALSSAATRWGSCSSDGRIRLNWRLIHFPLSIIDYVVAHELAHLREMNHSPRFWQTVESIFPEFKEARHTLKHHPPELLPAL